MTKSDALKLTAEHIDKDGKNYALAANVARVNSYFPEANRDTADFIAYLPTSSYQRHILRYPLIKGQVQNWNVPCGRHIPVKVSAGLSSLHLRLGDGLTSVEVLRRTGGWELSVKQIAKCAFGDLAILDSGGIYLLRNHKPFDGEIQVLPHGQTLPQLSAY